MFTCSKDSERKEYLFDLTSYCVHRFTCISGVSYTDETMRRLSDSIKEHNRIWLNNELIKNKQTAILEIPTQSNHLFNTSVVCPSFYVVRGGLANNIKDQIMFTTKAVKIHPKLSIHKPKITKNLSN